MNKFKSLFKIYPDNSLSTNLSIAGGGIKLLSLIILAAAIPSTAAVIISALKLISASGISTALIFIMDELDDLVFFVFSVWTIFILLRYISYALYVKAEFYNNKTDNSYLG